MWFGNVTAGDTITIPWDVVSLQSGSVTPTTAGSIRIYKGSSTTERSSASGITDTRTFDSVTGQNLVVIDLSDNTDAGFYAAGNDYHVMLVGAVVEGLTINKWLASFSIENRNIKANVTQWNSSAVATPNTAGVPKVDVTQFNGSNATSASGRPEVNITHISGSAVSTTTAQLGVNLVNIAGSAVNTTAAQLGVNIVNAAGTAWNSGAIGASTLATDTITAAKIAADAIGASELAADAVTEIQSGLATAAAVASVATDVGTIVVNTTKGAEISV